MVRIRDCLLSFEHHAGGFLDVLKFGVELGLTGILSRRDRISSLILVLVLFLVAVLVTWLEHLLNQLLPFRLFVHYFDIELWHLVGILYANRHLF